MTIYEPENRLLSDTELAGNYILDFPASGSVRNKLLMFINYLAYGIFCYSNENGLRMGDSEITF